MSIANGVGNSVVFDITTLIGQQIDGVDVEFLDAATFDFLEGVQMEFLEQV